MKTVQLYWGAIHSLCGDIYREFPSDDVFISTTVDQGEGREELKKRPLGGRRRFFGSSFSFLSVVFDESLAATNGCNTPAPPLTTSAPSVRGRGGVFYCVEIYGDLMIHFNGVRRRRTLDTHLPSPKMPAEC